MRYEVEDAGRNPQLRLSSLLGDLVVQFSDRPIDPLAPGFLCTVVVDGVGCRDSAGVTKGHDES